jgi:hypothetical protein
MLGLGDIVLPGVFVAMMLRFDAASGHRGSPYFYATFIAYMLGLATTIVVMHTFQAAQVCVCVLVAGFLAAPRSPVLGCAAGAFIPGSVLYLHPASLEPRPGRDCKTAGVFGGRGPQSDGCRRGRAEQKDGLEV